MPDSRTPAEAMSTPVATPGSSRATSFAVSYYRARYYDPTVGRFLSEDPLGFQGGSNFYKFVFNRPVQLVDPMGLSPQDVQRVKAACHRCTQQLVDGGMRQPGSGVVNGWINDLKSWGGKKQACKSQAGLVKNTCLDLDPTLSGWTFSEQPWWFWSHTVVMGRSPDPNDPVVFCDPWRGFSWTAPSNPEIPILPPM
jgi:RHS repeat-associated protein